MKHWFDIKLGLYTSLTRQPATQTDNYVVLHMLPGPSNQPHPTCICE